MKSRALPMLLGLALVSLLLVDTGSVWARAGGGGSRGSRSYSAPSRPAPSPVTPANPTSPSRPLTQPGPSPRPGIFGGLMGGIAGFALGGLLGSLLFGGMGGGIGGGLGGGIGLLEILLIGGGIFLLVRMLRSRGTAPEPAYAGAGASAYGAGDGSQSWSGGTTAVAPAAPSDLERGLGFIRQMDAAFDPAVFAQWAQQVFADVQAGITRRDMSRVNDRLMPQEFARLQSQCDQLRGARQTNRVEQIQIKRAEVSEAWQEGGQDWVTVYFAASLVDSTLDDTTGALVDGSRTPQDVEEYWTFARPVGPKPWRLSAIQSS
jgi:predicted lipid-binding transport protein (Tim44 family)